MRLPTEEQWVRVEALSEELAGLKSEDGHARLAQWAEAGESPTVLGLVGIFHSLRSPFEGFCRGDVIGGHYELQEELGAGSMGVVWRATQRTIERQVAVKILHPVLVSPALRKRAVDEIRVLGQLNHPGIIRIFDAGFHEDRRHGSVPYFAMELVEGVSLDRWAGERREDVPGKLRAMAAVCEAVQAAHDRGIVHRDLKPANILVRAGGSPVVLDFGIARLMGMDEGGEPMGFSGTPQYAAPEQHLGRDLDFRSGESVDVYALGAILFEVLAGRPLHQLGGGASIVDMRRATLEGPVLRLSEVIPGCMSELEDVVSRAVRRDPADRFYSVAALGRAIARVAEAMAGPVVEPKRWEPEVGAVVPGTGWRLEERLGEGGAGEVWSGRHDPLGAQCVFKFCSKEATVRTLKREFTLYRLLKERIGRNPHFVQLLEVSLDEPPWYLMMNHEHAEDLESWSARKPGGLIAVPTETRIEIVAQTAEALQAAHEAGILHRDVKPANLLIRQQTEGGIHVLVADFGIGQVMMEHLQAGEGRLGFTRTVSGLRRSELSGTMLYLAPEVLEGETATARSDIYSLGVVFWQLLSGNLKAALDVTDWPARITDALLREDLHRCLAGSPGKRWASAGELAASLRALPQRRAEAARRQAELAAREHAAYRRGVMRTAAAAGAALLLLLLLGAFVWSWKLEAARSRDQARRNYHAEQVSEMASLSFRSPTNRVEVASKILRESDETLRPTTDPERRLLADPFAEVLETDGWWLGNPFGKRGASLGAGAGALDVTGHYAIWKRGSNRLDWLDVVGGRVVPVPMDRFQGATTTISTSDGGAGEGLEKWTLALAPAGVMAAVAVGSRWGLFVPGTGTFLGPWDVSGRCESMAWSSDGLQVACGIVATNGEVYVSLHRASDGQEIRRLTGLDFPNVRRPSGMAFSPDDQWLAYWSLDSLHLLIWKVADGSLSGFRYHPAPVTAAVWGEGNQVVSAASDGFLYRWSRPGASEGPHATDRYLARYPEGGNRTRGHTRSWRQIAVREREGFMAALDEEGAVYGFDLLTGTGSKVVSTTTGVRSLGILEGRVLLTSDAGEVREFSRARSTILRKFPIESMGVLLDFDVSPDGRSVVCGGQSGVVVYDRQGVKHEVKDSLSQTHGIRWMDNGRLVGSSRFRDFELSWNGQVFGQIEPPRGGLFLNTNANSTPARVVIDLKSGFAVAARARSIRLGGVKEPGSYEVPESPEAQPADVVLSSGGRWMAWAETTGEVWVGAWDQAQLSRKRLGVSGSRLAFIGDTMLSVGDRAGISVVSVVDGSSVPVEGLDRTEARELAVQEGGPLAAIALQDGGIRLGMLESEGRLRWNPMVELGRERRPRFGRLRFVGMGRWLGGVSEDDLLHVWDITALVERLDAGHVLPWNTVTNTAAWVRRQKAEP